MNVEFCATDYSDRLLAGKIENILFVLSRARKPEDVDLPCFHLHPSKAI
jgi:hypothetical protein